MWKSHYPNFLNVRGEVNCKCSVLIRGIEFALSALYKICIIIIIIIIIIHLNVGIGVYELVKEQFQKVCCPPLFL
jgi:hypothetical protein